MLLVSYGPANLVRRNWSSVVASSRPAWVLAWAARRVSASSAAVCSLSPVVVSASAPAAWART